MEIGCKMKNLLIRIIRLYQKIPGNWHKKCRYIPTCSNYALGAIERFGAVKGSFLAIWRILRCNPLSKKIYDPVIKKGDNYEKNN